MRQDRGSAAANPPESPTPSDFAARRRSLRRAVSLDCSLACDSWDGDVVLPATDVSNEGLWVETPYALCQGEELVVSFQLPNAASRERVWAIVEVARVGMWRRRQDSHPAGMGLVFTYCSDRDRERLERALRGRPPRLPAAACARRQPPALPRGHARQAETGDEAELPAVLDWLLASE